MTIHLDWMTPVWILAGIGAAIILWLIVQFILFIFLFRD